MSNLRTLSILSLFFISICLSGCGKKEATPDTSGKTPGQAALEIMNKANEGKFDDVRKLMSAELIAKIESGKTGPHKTIKDYFAGRTKNQTITSVEVLEEGPGKIHPWKVDVKAHYKDGSSRSRVGFYFKLEDGLWLLTS